MMKVAIFIFASLGIIAYSWSSLRQIRSHGFYRFFAFESILALFLLNASYWFEEPFSLLHIIAWLLLIISLFLVVHAVYLLRVIGRPSGGIETTTTLVRQGAYKYIRHPLYSSLLFLAWGTFLKDISLYSVLLVLVATASLLTTARVEEAENMDKFGEVYADYRRATRMFIPFIF